LTLRPHLTIKGKFIKWQHLDQNMSAPLLRLSGVGEGIEICIETTLKGADSPTKVADSIVKLFPEFPIPANCDEPVLGQGSNFEWKATQIDMAHFLKLLHQQRILDTALDAMSKNLQGRTTVFELSRQAALAGKVSFPLPNEIPLGGVFTVTLTSDDLNDWLEAATWHSGRDSVPRTIGDESTMAADGEASTWV
jgi:predicted RNA binding protein with dsRBD fold (UPF0201 family)